ncbi:MAG: clumping factor, partial [Pseudonocardia sp.]|nr:clumping factor [Pseudonocardia sp.]
MSTTGERSTGTIYEQVQASPEFADLRSRLRRFVFPMSIAFLAWYLAYVLLASYARGFMAIKVFGNINVGLIIGLLQFVSTFAITTIYVRYANKHLDPAAE